MDDQSKAADVDKYSDLKSGLGSFYPKGFIMAAFTERADCDAAAAALAELGLDDVRTLTGPEFLALYDEIQVNRSKLAKLTDAAGTEQDDRTAYLHAADSGHCFVLAKLPDKQLEKPVRQRLLEHQAHLVRYFGEWVIDELGPRAGEAS
jgi:hypothetical protein